MSMMDLFERSEEFEAHLRGVMGDQVLGTLPVQPRHRIAVVAARLSIEHAYSARLLLLREGAAQSGVALLRLQYEALLRAFWVHFCASEEQVDKLAISLTPEAEQRAKNLPGPLDMLNKIVERAPASIHAPLQQFHLESWRALNSFVHAGIHPLSRATSGFPVNLAVQIVRNSNGLMHFAYRLQASFVHQALVDAVTHSYHAFEDCLPMTPSA